MDRRLRRNVCFALLGQGAALAAGGVGSLVLPKALGAEAFSYYSRALRYLPLSGSGPERRGLSALWRLRAGPAGSGRH